VPVFVQNRQRAVAINSARLGRTAEAVLSAARVEEVELSLLLVSDRRMRALNWRYRKQDRPTDVLAFPLLERFSAGTSKLRKPQALASGAPTLLGDVVISVETAKRQAAERGHGLYDEVIRLVVHGVLHLLGYDHERGPREAASMARKERKIRKAISDQRSAKKLKADSCMLIADS